MSKRKDEILEITETIAPWVKLEASIEDSESQTLQAVDWTGSLISLPTKADLPIKKGYLLEASSMEERNSSSETWETGGIVNRDTGDWEWFELDNLESVFAFFFPFDGIFVQRMNSKLQIWYLQ